MKRTISALGLVAVFGLAAGEARADSPQNCSPGCAAYASGKYEEAAAWYRKAAEQGDADAQYNLGNLYAQGQGVAQDDAQAVAWYRKAANQGYAKAQSNLGVMYAEGRGVARDDVEAYRWFSIAGAKGDAEIVKVRDLVEKRLSKEQIAEAQKRAREWISQFEKTNKP